MMNENKNTQIKYINLKKNNMEMGVINDAGVMIQLKSQRCHYLASKTFQFSFMDMLVFDSKSLISKSSKKINYDKWEHKNTNKNVN